MIRDRLIEQLNQGISKSESKFIDIKPRYHMHLNVPTILSFSGEIGHLSFFPQLGYFYLHCVSECFDVLVEDACNCTRVDSILPKTEDTLACSEFDTLFCSYELDKARGKKIKEFREDKNGKKVSGMIAE